VIATARLDIPQRFIEHVNDIGQPRQPTSDGCIISLFLDLLSFADALAGELNSLPADKLNPSGGEKEVLLGGVLREEVADAEVVTRKRQGRISAGVVPENAIGVSDLKCYSSVNNQELEGLREDPESSNSL